MQRIQVLDQITIDKIAAGEVIERPASIVKELVENAIDANASSVTVEIEDGGISMIRITDNGSGIQKEDIRNAFLRHSTSKIRDVDDLLHISSLGFRGEALSSIAAVSKVELITKTAAETYGSRYVIEGGKECSFSETGASDGTVFVIRQIFYNVPARRKFLKTAMTEAGHVQDLLIRLALSHPEIAFRFLSNGQEKLRTSGSGKLKEAIYHIYGRDVATNLLELDFEKHGFGMSGFIGKPLITRGNRNFETFFVNGRYVKNNMISKAIEDAYKDFSMQHKFPFVVIHFQADPATVDINVHPTKMELRFSRQQDIYDAVFEGIHRTLLEPELIVPVEAPMPKALKSDFSGSADAHAGQVQPPRDEAQHTGALTGASPFLLKPQKTDNANMKVRETASYQMSASPDVPLSGTQSRMEEAKSMPAATEPQAKIPPSTDKSQVRDEEYFLQKMRERVLAYHNRSSCAETAGQGQLLRPELAKERIQKAVADSRADADNQTVTDSKVMDDKGTVTGSKTAVGRAEEVPRQMDFFEEHLLKREVRAEYTLIGQVFDTYWLVQFHDQLYIIDQHAAHERVLYERTLREMKNREYTSQYLSPPLILTLTMQEEELLKTHMERFTRIGFEIEPFGGNSYAVRAVPDNLFSIAKKELLIEMLDQLSEDITTNMTPDLIDEKIASMSCKAAVKGNMRLSAREVDTLIGELLTLENPYHCPHGRPTIISMSKRELEKKFKRIV